MKPPRHHFEYRGTNPQELYKGTLKFPQNTNPKQLVFLIEECSFPQYVGKAARAIYKIEGNALTIAGHEPGVGVTPKRSEYPHARIFVVTQQQKD